MRTQFASPWRSGGAWRRSCGGPADCGDDSGGLRNTKLVSGACHEDILKRALGLEGNLHSLRKRVRGIIISSPGSMTALVSRTGRHQQRYEHGYRLVAGCIPYRYRLTTEGKCMEVLMISSQRGEGLLFPKGGWENDETVEEAACREALEEAGVRGLLKDMLGTWDFKSKRQQGVYCPEGLCRAYMFALAVTEQLDTWPEKHSRQRQWFAVSDAIGQCRHDWMRGALDQCVAYLAKIPSE